MDAVFALIWIGFFIVTLTVGGFIAEYVFPCIPAIERFLDKFEDD